MATEAVKINLDEMNNVQELESIAYKLMKEIGIRQNQLNMVEQRIIVINNEKHKEETDGKKCTAE